MNWEKHYADQIRAKEHNTSIDVIEKAVKAFYGGKGDDLLKDRYPNGCTLVESIMFFKQLDSPIVHHRIDNFSVVLTNERRDNFELWSKTTYDDVATIEIEGEKYEFMQSSMDDNFWDTKDYGW